MWEKNVVIMIIFILRRNVSFFFWNNHCDFQFDIFFIKKIKIKLLDQVSSYHHPRNSSGLICKKHQI